MANTLNVLLSTDEDGNEQILQYSPSEMEEVFNMVDLSILAGGGTVLKQWRVGGYVGCVTRVIDMTVAARANMTEGR